MVDRFLQAEVDARGGVSHYVLTGSHQPALQAAVSESLAGRTGLLELLPLSLAELRAAGVSKKRDCWMFDGFMPRLYDSKLPPTLLFADNLRAIARQLPEEVGSMSVIYAGRPVSASGGIPVNPF